MSDVCLICLEPTEGERYHAACLVELFGAAVLPTIDLDLGSLPARAQRSAGRQSISGVQEKFTMGLSQDRSALAIEEPGGLYILKPQLLGEGGYPNLPENEHLTMRLASRVGLRIPPCGLFALADRTWAYVIKRFDRVEEAQTGRLRKLRQLDLCQLADLDPNDKYTLSAERCAQLVRSGVAEPAAELRRLFQLFLFSYLVGNGDLHLKNISLLEGATGDFALSPGYDLSCNWLYGYEKMALFLSGKERDLKRGDWLTFARACDVPPEEAEQIIEAMSDGLLQSRALIERSPLPIDLQKRFNRLLQKRVRAIGRG